LFKPFIICSLFSILIVPLKAALDSLKLNVDIHGLRYGYGTPSQFWASAFYMTISNHDALSSCEKKG
jgi:hypothetical protein